MSSRPSKRGVPRLQIAKIFGVPIFVAATWLLFLVFVIGLYSPILHGRGNTWVVSVSLGLALALLWAVSVLAHELGHVYIAQRMGTTVHKVEIGLLGGLTETETHDERPSEEFWVSIVGPLVSIALAVPGLVSLALGYGLGFGAHGNIGLILATFTLSNVIVGIFNLLPGLPLDGGHMLVAAVWKVKGSRRAGIRSAAMVGQLMSSAIAIVGIVLLFQRRELWFEAAVALMVSWSLWDLASGSFKQSQREEQLEGMPIQDLIVPVATAAWQMTIDNVLARSSGSEPIVLIDHTDVPVAIVEASELLEVPAAHRSTVQVGLLATPLGADQVLTETTTMLELSSRMRTSPHPRYVITAADHTVIGVVNSTAVAAVG